MDADLLPCVCVKTAGGKTHVDFYAFFIPEIKIFTHPLFSYTFLLLIFDSLPFDTNLYFMNIDLMFVILGLVLLVINYLTGLGNETESF